MTRATQPSKPNGTRTEGRTLVIDDCDDSDEFPAAVDVIALVDEELVDEEAVELPFEVGLI
jgi:hypothetical protein